MFSYFAWFVTAVLLDTPRAVAWWLWHGTERQKVDFAPEDICRVRAWIRRRMDRID